LMQRERVGGSLSQHRLSYRDFTLLRWVAERCGSTPCVLVKYEFDKGMVAPVDGGLEDITVDELIEMLDALVDKGLLISSFHKKIIRCVKCGSFSLRSSTVCVKCRSEDLFKTAVYTHSCGATFPEQLVKTMKACPKCREDIVTGSFTAVDSRFVCNVCGEILADPACFVECLACGWVDNVKNAGYLIIKRYGVTKLGHDALESSDPAKQLARKLVGDGFVVGERVEVKGLSGATHVLDIVASNSETNETRVYGVIHKITPLDIVAFAVKKMDVEKTRIPGAVGRLRWVLAGFELDDESKNVAQSFGVEVELI